MESDEPEYEDIDELLDGLPWAIRNRVLREAFGEDSDRIEDEPVPDPPPYVEPPEPVMYVDPGEYVTIGPVDRSRRENALWWLLLPVAASASLTLVAASVLASAVLLFPLSAVLLALAALPVGSMAAWKVQTETRRHKCVTPNTH